jgi:hypothetical protein
MGDVVPIDPNKFKSRRPFPYASPEPRANILTFVEALAIVCCFVMAVIFFGWSMNQYDAAYYRASGKTIADISVRSNLRH